MDVTRETFFDLLPELEEAIEKALFISIDGEFTGLDNGSSQARYTPYDPPFEVYKRYFEKALDFLLIQFGMCIFYYDEKTQEYTHQAYNFYVFPHYEPDAIFKCQSSSLEFLAHEGFDFNKLFREGIPYLNEDEELRKRKSIEDCKAPRKSQNKTVYEHVPDEKKPYLKDICNQVRLFLEERDDLEYLALNPSNPYVRRLVHLEIEKEFGELVCLRTDNDRKDYSARKDKGIFVFRSEDKEKIQQFDEEAEKREWREFEAAIGFSHVIKLLSKSGKLIVGHNMLLDICHTMNRFVSSIPDNYDLFKSLLHRTFPRMIDTKTMTSLPPFQKYFQSTTLQSVLETLASDPFHIPECGVQVLGRGYSTLEAKEHEAGYDAYITGLCYLSLCDFLKKGEQNGVKEDQIACEFVNKVYVSVIDAPYINIAGEDPKPSRQHVFHLLYPHEWKRANVLKLFKSVGPVHVSFLSETRAYVALVDKSKASLVKKVAGGVITQYDTYHSIEYRRKLMTHGDESTSKQEQPWKSSASQNAGNSNERPPSTRAETSSGSVPNSNSKDSNKRGKRNKNRNDYDNQTSKAVARQRESDEELLSSDPSSKGGSNKDKALLKSSAPKVKKKLEDADDTPLVQPPPPKIRKELADIESSLITPPPQKLNEVFEVDDDWN